MTQSVHCISHTLISFPFYRFIISKETNSVSNTLFFNFLSSDTPRPGAHGIPLAVPLTGLSRRPYLDSLAAFTPDDESVISVAQLAEDPLVSLSQGGEVPDFPGAVWLISDRGKLIYTLAFREGLERLRVHADIVSGVEKAINEAIFLCDLVEAAQLLDHLGALLENGIAGALHPVSHFRAFGTSHSAAPFAHFALHADPAYMAARTMLLAGHVHEAVRRLDLDAAETHFQTLRESANNDGIFFFFHCYYLCSFLLRFFV